MPARPVHITSDLQRLDGPGRRDREILGAEVDVAALIVANLVPPLGGRQQGEPLRIMESGVDY
jgi:hypothetical protein